jgi:hypothetical protein
MSLLRIIVPLAGFICVSGATAQTSTSTTMDMGGGMTHTDTMGSDGSTSSTNCMDIGGGMKSCNTMKMGQPVTPSAIPDMSRPQTSGATLDFISGLISQSQEKSFQKKLRGLLESGDCLGASTLAYSKGRSELSDRILQSCDLASKATTQKLSSLPQFSVAQSEAEVQDVAAQINQRAPFFAPPMFALQSPTTISGAQAIGQQLLLTANVDAQNLQLTSDARSSIIDKLCADPSFPQMIRPGESIRIKYVEMSGKDIGSVMVTRNECGLR